MGLSRGFRLPPGQIIGNPPLAAVGDLIKQSERERWMWQTLGLISLGIADAARLVSSRPEIFGPSPRQRERSF